MSAKVKRGRKLAAKVPKEIQIVKEIIPFMSSLLNIGNPYYKLVGNPYCIGIGEEKRLLGKLREVAKKWSDHLPTNKWGGGGLGNAKVGKLKT